MFLHHEGGKRLAHVQVFADGASPTKTYSSGEFELIFPYKKPGDRVKLKLIKKDFEVVNLSDLNVILRRNPDDHVEIVMCQKGERNKFAIEHYKIKLEKNINRLKYLENSIKSARDNSDILYHIVVMRNIIGNIYLEKKEYSNAIFHYKKAMDRYQELNNKNNNLYLQEVLVTYNGLGKAYFELKDYKNAHFYQIKLLEIERTLAKEESLKYDLGLCSTLLVLCKICYYRYIQENNMMFKNGIIDYANEVINISKRYPNDKIASKNKKKALTFIRYINKY